MYSLSRYRSRFLSRFGVAHRREVRAIALPLAFALLGAVPAPATAAITFSPKVGYGTGRGPSSVAAGDFNGDGVKDLAVTDWASDSVSVLLGRGNGTFVETSHYATNHIPDQVAVGDFNGDGSQDLAIVYLGSDTVSVLLGNGDGTFARKVDYVTGHEPSSVAVADLNRDRRQDLVVGNEGGAGISVLLGNGDGTFAAKVDYPTDRGPLWVAIGDFDRDGIKDLVVVNNFVNTVSVLLGRGDGSFAPAVDYPVGEDPASVAVGDFNRDGIQDLAVVNANACSAGSVSILLGNGDGTFASKVDYVGGGDCPQAVAVGDFDQDGKPDLAVANGAEAIYVWRGNGNGTLRLPVSFLADLGARSLAVSDFNGDGRPDLADNGFSFAASILLNAPTAEAGPTSLRFGTSASPVPRGMVSTPRRVTIANHGSASLRVSGFAVTGANPADFFTSTDSCHGLVAPGASCFVQVRFAPRAKGSRTAMLTVLTNAPTNPRLSLVGTSGPPLRGPRGKRGPRGRPGRNARVSCTVSNNDPQPETLTCSVVLARKKSGVRVRWRLVRRGRTVMCGVAVSRRGRVSLWLSDLARLRPGRYVVHIEGRRRGTSVVIR